MSEFKVEVIQLGDIEKHPNADTLGITSVNGYPVVVRLGEFQPGDKAIYVPIDSIVPETEQWSFLGSNRRIKAKRLRGVFSMGLLVDLSVLTKDHPHGLGGAGAGGWDVGDPCELELGITKWEPEIERAGKMVNTDDEPDPGFLPVYTDIEGLRRYKHVLKPGEEVVLTEKIHGANARFLYRDGHLWVGSHKRIKKLDERNMWWKVALDLKLEERLCPFENIAIYGEVYGQVQDLKYGKSGVDLVLFDAMDTVERRYLDYDVFCSVALALGLPRVPELYRGPWDESLVSYAEGKTTLAADHVREGFVVRPVVERREHVGRVIFKMVGENYLLRKGT